jgi:hypothetical protein
MSECSVRPADRQFRRRCVGIASSCLVSYIACAQLAMKVGHGPAGMVLAGFAGAFFFAELVTVALLVVRMRDEFQRALLTQSFVWATVVTMAIATVWGFVELHGRDGFPHMPVLLVPALLIVFTTAAKVIVFRRHKSPAE